MQPTDVHTNISKILLGIHFGLGVAAMGTLYFFGSPETRDLFLILLTAFILSPIPLLVFYRKALTPATRAWLICILLLPAMYVGVWAVLGLLMMH